MNFDKFTVGTTKNYLKNLLANLLTVLGMVVLLLDNIYAAVETPDSEELRNRSRQEAQEREQQQKLPNVNLQGEIFGTPLQLLNCV